MKRLPARFLYCLVLLAIVPPARAQFGGPAKVTVADIEMRPLPASTTLVGTVQPVTRSIVGAEIAGLVEQVPVRQGDFVRAGDLICKLKDDTVSLELAEAQASLKSLEAAYRKWKSELERVQKLYGDQDAAEKEVYDTVSEHDQARYAVARQQAVVARLEAELAKTEIRAPFSGFVVQRFTEVGQWLNTGGNVVDLADLASVLITVDVPEQALPYARVGDRAWAKIDALNQSFEGRVRHVMLQADPTARTFPVEIEVPNPGYVEVDGRLLPRTIAERQSAAENPTTALAAGNEVPGERPAAIGNSAPGGHDAAAGGAGPAAAHDAAAGHETPPGHDSATGHESGVGHGLATGSTAGARPGPPAGHGPATGSDPGASPGPPGGHGAGRHPGAAPPAGGQPAENAAPPPPDLLAGGMFARVTIQSGASVMTPAVPKDAVVNRNGVEFVAMVVPGREEGSLMAVPVPVTTGLDIGDWIAVTSGNLHPGMQVVADGSESIMFPTPIQIVQFGEQPAATTTQPAPPPGQPHTGS